MPRNRLLKFATVLHALMIAAPVRAEERLPLETIKLPPGFQIDVYAAGVPNARSLAWGAEGTLFIGTRTAGRVYAVRDTDGDHRADKTYVIAEGLRMPNGVAFRDGALYVAEISRVLRFDGIEARLEDPPPPAVVRDDLPKEQWHGWKFIAFGPDGRLYVPVGAPCNVCDPGDPYASIARMDSGGAGLEIFARGVRNTVGFDWDSQGALWFTDNGRDYLGDDLPSDELNRAPEAGMHFGFPYCHGRETRDPEFGSRAACGAFAAPEAELGAHVAALGMRFYTGGQFPEEYRGDIFIAQHGSWNRSEPVGYRVARARVEDGAVARVEVFAEGWLGADGPWGRPVDVLVAPDGSLLVSDDLAGAVYRVTWSGE